MIQLDANNSELRVYVRRAGLLKRFGHDLELHARSLRGEIDLAASSVWLVLDAATIHVVSAVERRERRPALSPAEAAQIDQNVAQQVLAVAQYPQIEFRSTQVDTESARYRVRGALSLHGHTRELTFAAQLRGERFEGELALRQPDFGIEPFRALGGTLRLEPAVEIVFSLPGK